MEKQAYACRQSIPNRKIRPRSLSGRPLVRNPAVVPQTDAQRFVALVAAACIGLTSAFPTMLARMITVPTRIRASAGLLTRRSIDVSRPEIVQDVVIEVPTT